jgi:PAS domain S-box-containing protein
MALAATSLSRRFAIAAAILTAAAVTLVSLASFWVVNRQRATANHLVQQREVAFHAKTVADNLLALSRRMAEVADSPILATGLIDSAGKETYLMPFLHGLRQLNGIPVQVLFTDFEAREIASNGMARFSENEIDWLREQMGSGKEAVTIRDNPGGAELIGVELLRYSRTSTPEGALMYKVRLADLKPAPSADLAWGPARTLSRPRGGHPDGIMSMPLDLPPNFAHLSLRLEEEIHRSATALDDPAPQYTVILGIAFALATVVFLIGSRLALGLTRDLRQLETFSSSLGDDGISTQRAQLGGSAEVSSLARSINRMLDRLYEQHSRLQTERQRFYQLANTIPQLAWIADADGSINWYNDRWYAYTGTTPEEMKGWGWQSVSDPAVLPQVLRQWKETIASGQMMQMTFPLRGADGVYRQFFMSVAPLRDERGEIVQWFGTNTDVSLIEEAEKAVRQSEQRLQQGLVAACMAVWDWDVATGRLGFSANLHSVFGESWSTMHRAWQLIDPEDLAPLRAAIDEAIERQGEYHGVVRIHRPDDQRVVWVEMRGRVDADAAGPQAVHAIAIDVTERMRAEEALRMADRRKDEFLAMLAHELRNPLAPISTAAQLLNLLYVSEPKVKETSDIISRQVEHMTRLVDDLLDVSRVTRGLVTIKREALDMKDIVAEAVDQTRPLIEARRHQVSFDLPAQPVWIDGDHTRLVQVTANLLNNAAKYTPEGGEIHVSLVREDEQAVLRVRDNGAGISPELQPELFELFSQGKRTLDRSQGGLGLGLALVKKLVELHGGSVGAYSEGAGRGSEFTFRLPLRLKAPDTRSAKPAPADADVTQHSVDRPLRVMVVDDNIDAANTLAMLLQADGHSVIVEYTAQAALYRAADESLDALLLDIGLPDMDGYELARRLRQMPQTMHCILVAVTGYGQRQDQLKSQEAGFADHIVKPINRARLSSLIAQLRELVH